jgi:hypothetical protein
MKPGAIVRVSETPSPSLDISNQVTVSLDI